MVNVIVTLHPIGGSMMTENTLYIAETDELGRVVCVWCSNERSRPKPLKAPISTQPKLKPAQAFGATPEDVAAWMQSHSTARSGPP